MFSVLDGDSNGFLDRNELLASPEVIALIRNDGEDDTAAVERFLSLADANDDKKISFSEFTSALAPRLATVQSLWQSEFDMVDMEAVDSLAKSRKLFDLIDNDNNGFLDEGELLESPSLLALIRDEDTEESDAEAVARFMQFADENQDGLISFVEFAIATAKEPRLQLADDTLSAVLSLSAQPPQQQEEEEARQEEEEEEEEEEKEEEGQSISGSDGRRSRSVRASPAERFDSMLAEFLAWDDEEDNHDDDDAAARGGGGGGGRGTAKMTNNQGQASGAAAAASAAAPPGVAWGSVWGLEDAINDRSEDQTRSGDGRLREVMAGALVGARCPTMVGALRVCYLRYSPLRLGLDLTFSLLKRVREADHVSTS